MRLSLGLADVIVLAVIICLVALVVRSMLRGTVRVCDGTSCGSCGATCPTPRIRLSKEQIDRLDALSKQAEEA